MPTLYIITGPAGAGKSTVSRRIAETKKKSALIEGDDIYGQIKGGYIDPWEEGNYLDTFWKLCLSQMKIYLEDGFDVVFNYIISPDQLAMIKNAFPDAKIVFAVIMVDAEELLRRDSERLPEFQMKERCLVLLDEFRKHNYAPECIVNTTDMTVDEAVRLIESDGFGVV